MRNSSFVLSRFLCLITCIRIGVAVIAIDLVPEGSSWRYFKGTREASAPDKNAWKLVGFNDADWLGGTTPVYYGESFDRGTVITDMQNKYSTIFLRKVFEVADTNNFTGFRFSSMCDDGFVAWLNGVQIASQAAPTGDLNFNSLASANIAEPISMQEISSPPLTTIRKGSNVLAIQVFNVTLNSSDLVIEAALSADLKEVEPPRVLKVEPIAGVLTALDTVTVTFTEPVRGVTPDDLLINGFPALSVVGSGAVYRFNFEPVPAGPAQLSWNVAHGISDTSVPANVFNGDLPGGTVLYEVVDATPPVVKTTRPSPATTVGQFREFEILFSEPVVGVDPNDLLINGKSAIAVEGGGAGPYVFTLESQPTGRVQVSLINSAGIEDIAGNVLSASTWELVVDASLSVPSLVITEFMAENGVSYKDEESDTPDWIEIQNRGTKDVPLLGLSLTDDKSDPGKWVFPAITLRPNQFLIVFASGKDRKPTTPGARLHTNFKLGDGEYVGLYSADSPRRLVSEIPLGTPSQRPDYSYGLDPEGRWKFYQRGTPGTANPLSLIAGEVSPVHFGVGRGYYDAPFQLHMATETPGAEIRYTTNGSLPNLTNGFVFNEPIRVASTQVIRAGAFAPNLLPSEVVTHTYLFNLPSNRRQIPALSLVTATNNLYGTTGIMESNPRNTAKHGILWERPVSVEYLRPDGEDGFAVTAGLRVQGGGYIRNLYNYRSSTPPTGKYSFRLYFRGDYGAGRLSYPLIPGAPSHDYDTLVLRAGMNDPTNPFVADELVRRIAADTGQPASRGTFVHLFLNGQYKGYYNPTERIDVGFLQAHHSAGDKWDEIAQGGEVREGDSIAWNSLKSLVLAGKGPADPTTYAQIGTRLDLVNYIDYLLVNIYAGTGDWPHNNWRSARERAPGGLYRFYLWDAEWSFENQGRSVSGNTLTTELGGDSEIANMYRRLRLSGEFRQLFADRVHKHFFNGGALTDESVKKRAEELRLWMASTITGFRNPLSTSWVNNRRRNIFNHMNSARLFMSSNAPALSQFGGSVGRGYALKMTNQTGMIYYTMNGVDPRVPFTETVNSNAMLYSASTPPLLNSSIQLKARSLSGTNWSALVEATFQVTEIGNPLRITEIMYNPPGGDAYEYIEITNTGNVPASLAGVYLTGIDYRFSDIAPPLAAGARLVLSSAVNTVLFAARYPGIKVYATYAGSLSNAGERLQLITAQGEILTAVNYSDDTGWPLQADGGGSSIELIQLEREPSDPMAWSSSKNVGGTPGAANGSPSSGPVIINELLAENVVGSPSPNTHSDWVELKNTSSQAVDISNWSLSDGPNPRRFVFPNGTVVAANGFLMIWCDSEAFPEGIHTGFALKRSGDSLFLYDSATNRIDGIQFGPQMADMSLARLDGASDGWGVGIPTFGRSNVAAAIAPHSKVLINEYLADAISGEPDWIELFNSDPSAPVDLHGSYISTLTVVDRLLSHIVIPPRGHVVLLADEGNGLDRLNFKLSAVGGQILFQDSNGAVVDRVNYSLQAEGVSEGRSPDGSSSITRFPASATPGAANVVLAYAGPVLNEVLSNVRLFKLPTGETVNWIELYNPSATAFDMGGMSLSIGEKNPGAWAFPAGTSIPSKGFLVVRCDPDSTSTKRAEAVPNSGFEFSSDGGGVFLFNAGGQVVDSVEFGFQLQDLSIGKVGLGWELCVMPTPGTSNSAIAPIGVGDTIRFNEWMAAPVTGNDWFELYNSGPLPVNLGMLLITDEPSVSGRLNSGLRPLSFIAPLGWVLYEASDNTNAGPNHVGFLLNEIGDSLRLYQRNGQLIDGVDFGIQKVGVSEGRFPDGGTIVPFPGTPTPGDRNFAPVPGLVINEVLAHSDAPYEDAIEFFNQTDSAIDLSHWFLSNAPKNPKKYRFPAGTTVPPQGYLVVYQWQFDLENRSGVPFTINSAHGDQIILSSADAAGNLTGYRLEMFMPPSENGISWGRVNTSTGSDFAPLLRPTFGIDNPETLEQFRIGRGKINETPKLGSVVLSEIYFSPTATPSIEFVEIYNPNNAAVALFDPQNPENTWKLLNAVEFEFPRATVLGAGQSMVLVGFDPVLDISLAQDFRRRYSIPDAAIILGPLKGRLNNQGESVEIYKPDPPQAPTRPDAGFVPYILVEKIHYGASLPWPVESSLDTASLQRRSIIDYANDPINWYAAAPNPGRFTPASVESDADKDGILDAWERANGLNPLDANDAQQDSDNDGRTNLQEYISNTNPRSAASVLKLAASINATGSWVIEFQAEAGRRYALQRRVEIEAAVWATERTFESETAPRTIRIGNAPSGFYRLVCVIAAQ